MQVGLHANVCDSSTEHIARALHSPFGAISRDLSRDYGGTIEHLWIDFELREAASAWPFRFQKRVGGSSPDRITGLPRGLYENVAHYSVKPDFRELRSVPEATVVSYALRLIYSSTSILLEKKKLAGFDVERFRSDFLISCRVHGYEVGSPTGAA